MPSIQTINAQNSQLTRGIPSSELQNEAFFNSSNNDKLEYLVALLGEIAQYTEQSSIPDFMLTNYTYNAQEQCPPSSSPSPSNGEDHCKLHHSSQ